MKNADQPINPDPMRGAEQTYSNQNPYEHPTGLTKREYFVGLAMQGLLSNNLIVDGCEHDSMKWIAEHAILQADELLKQLEL